MPSQKRAPGCFCAEDQVRRLVEQLGRERLLAEAHRLSQGCTTQWCARTLSADGTCRSSLLFIRAGGLIPLHDHPGSFGADLCLLGRGTRHQFTVAGKANGLWVLQRDQTTRMRPGRLSRFGARRGNAHSFAADGSDCVLVALGSRTADAGYWYYPTNSIQSRKVLAVRAKRLAEEHEHDCSNNA